MKLYQFLRKFQSGVPICIFDIAGICICQVESKQDIPLDLYDYDILDISVGIVEYLMIDKRACQYITIEK